MSLPTMQTVDSSNIVAIGYEPADRYLFVKFKSGLYRHEDVSSGVYADFMGAESKGRFYSAEIKGKYPSSKITDEIKADEEKVV